MKKNGFTLMETIVALGIAALAASFFLLAFVPASSGVKQSEAIVEAKLLAGALEAELNTARQTLDNADNSLLDALGVTNTTEISHFHKAFAWVSNSTKVTGTTIPQADSDALGSGIILAFKYRAFAHADDDDIIDGIYPAYTGDDFTESSDTQPMALRERVGLFPQVDAELGAVSGSVFAVSLTQIHLGNSGSYVLNTSPALNRLTDSNGVSVGYNAYTEGEILLQADFYLLESNSAGYINSVIGGGQDMPSKPVYSTRIGINR